MAEFLVAASLFLFTSLDLAAVAARASFLHVNHARLLALREQEGEKVNRTLAMLSTLPRLEASLSLVLVTTRFIIAALVVLQVLLSVESYAWVFALALLLVSAVILFWIEWAFQSGAIHNAEAWSVRLTGLARLLMALAALFLFPFKLSSDSPGSQDGSSVVSEDEVKSLVDAGQEEGVFEQGERRMIYSVFQFRDTLAREIMVPRIDVLALDVHTPLQDAVDALLRSGHSRVPVYEETVDQTLGLLYSKDLLRLWREGERLASLRELLRPAYFVPEAKNVDELLAEMQAGRFHMAIVVDEYGGVAGLVTLEDIVEEIVGEIQDEYDQAEEAPYQALPDGSFLFQGRINLDNFNEIMGSDLPSDEADSLGGYIYSRLGRVPALGEEIHTDDLVLTVEQVSARRIGKVGARRLYSHQDSEEQARVDR